MDVVIRTTHGEAEVSIDRPDAAITLGELVERVIGRPSPPVVDVDARATSTTTRLDRCGLTTGSSIDVDHRPAPSVPVTGGQPASVDLVVVAGPGTSARAPLGAGSYRVGPGRRVHAAELESAAVENGVLELDVDGAGTVTITVPDLDTGPSPEVQLDGVAIPPGSSTIWRDGVIDVADRAFELQAAGGTTVIAPPRALADADGKIPFERSPGDPTWRRRITEPDALRLPIGLHVGLPGPPGLVTVDFATERGLGIAGDDAFGRGLARAIVVQAAERLGPADLDIVVMSDPGRASAWEWVKWLPHTRVDDRPGPYCTPTDVAAWIGRAERPDRRWGTHPYHLTLVVVDEQTWWHGRSAPLRHLLDDPAAPMRWIVIGGSTTSLPAVCRAVVGERRDDGAVLEALDGGIERFLPFLMAPERAREIALSLAPLDDQALRAASGNGASRPWTSAVDDVLGVDPTDPVAVAERWRSAAGLRIGVGEGGDGPAHLDLSSDGPHALLAGVDPTGGVELARALVVGLATANAPADLALVLVDVDGSDAFGPTVRLPHVIRTYHGLDAVASGDLARRLRAEVASRRAASLTSPPVVVVVHTAGGADALSALADVLVEVADDLGGESPRAPTGPGLHLVVAVTTTEDDPVPVVDARLAERAGVRVALRLRHTVDSIRMLGDEAAVRIPHHDPGRALLTTGHGHGAFRVLSTAGPARGGGTTGRLAVRPFVVARDPTPMERRLAAELRSVHRAAESSAGTLLDQIVDTLLDASALAAPPVDDARRQVVRPLPPVAHLDDLLAEFPGDSVPYALVDEPSAGFTDTVGTARAARWWRPGGATIVLHAADADARDHVTDAIGALVTAAGARVGSDEVVFHVVTPSGDRLEALAAAPLVETVLTPDDVDAVSGLAAGLVAELGRRSASGPPADGRTPVLVLDQLEVVRSKLPVDAWDRLWMVVRDGAAAGMPPVVTLDARSPLPPGDVAPGHQWHVAFDPASGTVTAVDGRGVAGRLVQPSARERSEPST